MNETSNEAAGPRRSDARYLTVVGILLVLIISLLAVLWVKERRRRRSAEREYATLRAQHDGMRGVLGQLLAGGTQRRGPPVRRDELGTEKVSVNGRDRTAMRISADAGRQLGLRAGDIIIVSEQPAPATTAPATAPATADGE